MKKPIVVLAGPSGCGKSTLLKELLRLYGTRASATVSYTTRRLRGQERDSKDYHYVSQEKFKDLVKKNFFVEWACVYGCYYGTSRAQLLEHWRKGRMIIKDYDLQGADLIKKHFPQALRIFILPPSLSALKQRISQRKENTPQEIQQRLKAAKEEILRASQFDCQIANINLKETTKKLKQVIDKYVDSMPSSPHG